MIITITVPEEQVPILEAQINKAQMSPIISHKDPLTADAWITNQVQSQIDLLLLQDKKEQLAKLGLAPTADIDQETINKLKETLTPIV